MKMIDQHVMSIFEIHGGDPMSTRQTNKANHCPLVETESKGCRKFLERGHPPTLMISQTEDSFHTPDLIDWRQQEVSRPQC